MYRDGFQRIFLGRRPSSLDLLQLPWVPHAVRKKHARNFGPEAELEVLVHDAKRFVLCFADVAVDGCSLFGRIAYEELQDARYIIGIVTSKRRSKSLHAVDRL